MLRFSHMRDHSSLSLSRTDIRRMTFGAPEHPFRRPAQRILCPVVLRTLGLMGERCPRIQSRHGARHPTVHAAQMTYDAAEKRATPLTVLVS